MKTSKIKRIESVKEWGEGERKILYHNLEMENGDKINIGKKKPQEVGYELTYEIIGEDQEYNKAKSVQKQEGGFKGGNNASFALSYAKDIVCANYNGEVNESWWLETSKTTTAIADEFLKWLNENS